MVGGPVEALPVSGRVYPASPKGGSAGVYADPDFYSDHQPARLAGLRVWIAGQFMLRQPPCLVTGVLHISRISADLSLA